MNPEFVNGYKSYWDNELPFPFGATKPFQLGWSMAEHEINNGEYKDMKYNPVIGANPWLGVPIELVM